MHTEPAIERPASPAPTTVPEPVRPGAEAPSAPSRSAFARVMSVLHGDKYMVGAYPPDWPQSAVATIPDAGPHRDRAAATGDLAAPPKER
jgi:hypothetical protein